jgi:hypothetical protein
MLAAGGSQRVPPAAASLLTASAKKNPAARMFLSSHFANPPENAAKMCACSNTLTAKPKNTARFLNVTVNKSTDIVQGLPVRADSNSRAK